MKDALGMVLLAGGAFAIYEIFFKGASAPVTSGGTVQPTTANTNTNTVAQNQTVESTNPTVMANPIVNASPQSLSQLLSAAAGNPMFGLTADEWSYYYARLTGRNQIDPNTFNSMLNKAGITDSTRNNPMTADYFVGMLSSVGLSGLGRVYVSGYNGPIVPRGLGVIGAGYGINQLHGSDASYYERAVKVSL